jgi:hypothetical protein
MIIMKLAMAALLGAVAASALAQAPPIAAISGIHAGLDPADLGLPRRSNNASNIVPSDTEAGTVRQSCHSPHSAWTPDQAKMASGDATVAQIRNALHALGDSDRADAIQIIDAALE